MSNDDKQLIVHNWNNYTCKMIHGLSSIIALVFYLCKDIL